jgi:hypothetical protein
MIRKYNIQLEVVVRNKSNLIYEAHQKQPISVHKVPSLNEAIKITLEQASYYIDVHRVTINSGE